MPTQTNPGGAIDPASIGSFMDEYAKLEALVSHGDATAVEQVVFLTAQLALQSARDAEELRKMLQQLRDSGGVVYVTYHFPRPFRDNFMYAGRLYQLLIDTINTLPPYPVKE